MTTSNWHYRALLQDDQPQFRALRLEELTEFPTALLSTAEELRKRSADQDRDLLAHGRMRGVYTSAKGDAQLVAMAAYLPNAHPSCAHRAEIGAFYVTRVRQGTGLAQYLMAALAAEARADGRWQLELFVAADNARARRFYEREGFKVAGQLPNAAFLTRKFIDDLFLVRDLR